MIGMAQAVTGWVAGIVGVPTGFGDFPAPSGAGCMVRAEPGDPVVREYMSGGGEYRFAYAVYLRCPARADGERYDGLAALQRVADAIAARGVPEAPEGAGVIWSAHVVTQQPSIFRTESNGYSTYQLTAQVRWIERSN